MFPSEELTIVANIKKAPNSLRKRIVFSCPVQDGSHDNAAAWRRTMEMATVSAQLIKKGNTQRPKNYDLPLGGWNHSTKKISKRKWKKRSANIKWGESWDMVGAKIQPLPGYFFKSRKCKIPVPYWTPGVKISTRMGRENLLSLEEYEAPFSLNDYMLHLIFDENRGNLHPLASNSRSLYCTRGSWLHTPFFGKPYSRIICLAFLPINFHT